MIDDKAYWESRHNKVHDLKAPGLRSVSDKANQYIYKSVISRYEKLLTELDLKDCKSLFDAGYGDGKFLKSFNNKYPDLELHGVDISIDAKNKVNISGLEKSHLQVGNLSDESIFQRKYDIVHCFDVLYHILDDHEFEQAITNLCKSTDKYLIIHDKFVKRPQIFSKPHVRMRTGSIYEKMLKDNGFTLNTEISTHIFAMRGFTYLLNRYFAKELYEIDRYLFGHLSKAIALKLGTHFIRVYTRG